MELLSCASTLVTDPVDAGCREVVCFFSEVQLDRFEVLGCVCRVQAERARWMFSGCVIGFLSLYFAGVSTNPITLIQFLCGTKSLNRLSTATPQIELTVSHAFFNFNTLPFDMSADDYARRH